MGLRSAVIHKLKYNHKKPKGGGVITIFGYLKDLIVIKMLFLAQAVFLKDI